MIIDKNFLVKGLKTEIWEAHCRNEEWNDSPSL